ncbi:diacylglycerol/lipid kinase family protein [Kaistella palustris]|uniref:diacylglycerol/lipid kinase family protein n=1 Tax=Kaistella palustris TaxID=493376 RepID=UPI00040D8372|nr:YegS/Rv2252/BmrU family lipid kinase [Kaistella palustris]
MEKVAFIINPFSAHKNYEPFLEALRQKVTDPQIYISDSVHGTEQFIADHFEKVDVFVAVGGDGTISSVAKKLINTDKILGIFPAGSGNGFSRETDFSTNLAELLKKINTRDFREIDTFKVNDELSINVSGTGFDGEVAKNFEKTSRGFANYIKVSIQTFFNFKPLKVKFTAPEFQKHNGDYLMVNIANTRQFGNNAFIAPHASTVDGLAEVVLVKKFSLLYGTQFALKMFTGKLKQDRKVTYLSVPEISFSTDSSAWHLDGEYREIPSPIHIKVLPKSLKILI